MARRGKRGSGLSGVDISLLQAELRRRQRSVGGLMRRRERLMERVAALDEQIRALGGATGGSGRGGPRGPRPRNEMTLVDALQRTLKGKTMGVTEVAEAVQKNGYNTSSPNFRTIVNQALIKNRDVFKKVERGQYTAA